MPIGPHTSLHGPQLAGWTPRDTPPAEYRLREEADVALPMPDGVRLRADGYRPHEPRRFAALDSLSAYPRFTQNLAAPASNHEAGVVGLELKLT